MPEKESGQKTSNSDDANNEGDPKYGDLVFAGFGLWDDEGDVTAILVHLFDRGLVVGDECDLIREEGDFSLGSIHVIICVVVSSDHFTLLADNKAVLGDGLRFEVFRGNLVRGFWNTHVPEHFTEVTGADSCERALETEGHSKEEEHRIMAWPIDICVKIAV